MSTALFRGYDRAGLDREYDNRVKVPGFDFAAFQRQCEQASAEARQKFDCVLDVPYGSAPAEKLDIFKAKRRNAPVHVFIHGGYWRMLDKKDFSYVASGLVPHDVTTVVLNYALIPTVNMDELVAQCRRAVQWVIRNIAEYGGDPQAISVSGHSAGGHLVAMLLAEPAKGQLGHASGSDFTHACAISGIFELEPISLCFLNDILNLQPQEIKDNSPRFLKREQWCPLTVAVGAQEGDEYLRQSSDFVQAWTGNADQPRLLVLPGQDHFSIRAQLGEPDSEMVQLVLGGDINS